MRVDSRGSQALVSALGLRGHPSTWPGFMRTQPRVTPLCVFCRCLFPPFPLGRPSHSLGHVHHAYMICTPYVHHKYKIRTPYVHHTYTISTRYVHHTYTMRTRSVLHDSWLAHRHLKPHSPIFAPPSSELLAGREETTRLLVFPLRTSALRPRISGPAGLCSLYYCPSKPSQPAQIVCARAPVPFAIFGCRWAAPWSLRLTSSAPFALEYTPLNTRSWEHLCR